MTAFIIDDELKAREVLSGLLQKHCPAVEVLGTAASVQEARRSMNALKADVVFLDIHLGEENSFALLEEPAFKASSIVFTTGHSEYALKAFGYRATHYLLKPIEVAQLKEAVERVRMRKNEAVAEEKEVVKKEDGLEKRIALPDMHGYELVQMEDIIRLEGDGAYTLVVIKQGDKKMISRSLGYFEEKLPQGHFFRIHKKHIINLKELVKCTREKTPVVTLSNGDELTVSWRLRSRFFEQLKRSTSF